MTKIAIVTDSASNLSEGWKKRHHIFTVPFTVHFGHETYLDGVNLTTDELNSLWLKRKIFPSTAVPTALDFLTLFDSLADCADAIVVPVISSGISQTAASAQIAARLFDRLPVQVIDTRTASVGQSLVVRAISQAIEQGLSLTEVRTRANDVIKKLSSYLVVEDPQFLPHRSLIENPFLRLPSLLHTAPIFRLNETGRLTPLGQAHTKQKALNRLLHRIEDQNNGDLIYLGIAHSCSPEEVLVFQNEVEKNLYCEEIIIEQFSPAIYAHLGPGAVGLAFYPEKGLS